MRKLQVSFMASTLPTPDRLNWSAWLDAPHPQHNQSVQAEPHRALFSRVKQPTHSWTELTGIRFPQVELRKDWSGAEGTLCALKVLCSSLNGVRAGSGVGQRGWAYIRMDSLRRGE